MPYAT